MTKAFNDDLMPTTHPITAPCESSDSAESLIDGITYGKGACFVRLLILRIGMDNFLTGCKLYFDKFKWKNSTLDNFLACMQEVHDRADDLQEFSSRWLKTKGVSVFKAKIQDNQLRINQGFAEHGD